MNWDKISQIYMNYSLFGYQLFIPCTFRNFSLIDIFIQFFKLYNCKVILYISDDEDTLSASSELAERATLIYSGDTSACWWQNYANQVIWPLIHTPFGGSGRKILGTLGVHMNGFQFSTTWQEVYGHNILEH